MSYKVENSPLAAPDAARNTWTAMARGVAGRCPACGRGALYGRYLKVVDTCAECGTELHHQRADDAPPYFTILIVAHVVGGGILSAEQMFAPSTLTHLLIWLPMTLVMSLLLLPRIKGALVGLQWAQHMHGFDGAASPTPESPSVTGGAAPKPDSGRPQ